MTAHKWCYSFILEMGQFYRGIICQLSLFNCHLFYSVNNINNNVRRAAPAVTKYVKAARFVSPYINR